MTKRDCTSCEHYLKIDEPPFVMACTFFGLGKVTKQTDTDMGDCDFHTKLDEWAAEEEAEIELPKSPGTTVLKCQSCGHGVTIIGLEGG